LARDLLTLKAEGVLQLFTRTAIGLPAQHLTVGLEGRGEAAADRGARQVRRRQAELLIQTQGVDPQAAEAGPLLALGCVQRVAEGVGRRGVAVDVGLAFRPARRPVDADAGREIITTLGADGGAFK